MEETNDKFVFVKENGEEVECEVVFDFYSEELGKNYMLLTDNTNNSDGDLNVYVYYTDPETEDLIPVDDEKEFTIVEKIFQDYKDGVR